MRLPVDSCAVDSVFIAVVELKCPEVGLDPSPPPNRVRGSLPPSEVDQGHPQPCAHGSPAACIPNAMSSVKCIHFITFKSQSLSKCKYAVEVPFHCVFTQLIVYWFFRVYVILFLDYVDTCVLHGPDRELLNSHANPFPRLQFHYAP